MSTINAASALVYHHAHPNYPNYILKMKTKKVHFTMTFEALAGYSTDNSCCINSPPIEVQGTTWRLRLYPGGADNSNFRHISLYLVSENYGAVKGSFSLSLVSTTGSKEFTKTVDTVTFDYRPEIREYPGSYQDLNCFGVRNYMIRTEAIEPQRRYCIDATGTLIVCVDIVLYEGFESEALPYGESISTGSSLSPQTASLKKNSIMEQIKNTLTEQTISDLDIHVRRTESLAEMEEEAVGSTSMANDESPEIVHSGKRRKIDDSNIITAHKFILSLRSDVFRAMFDSHMQEANSNTLLITDFHIDVVREMLYFLYTDSCHMELLPDLSHNLLAIACKYHIEGLKQICEHYLCSILSVSNALELLELSDMYEAKLLKAKALMFVARNAKPIFLRSNNDEDKIIAETQKYEIVSRLGTKLASELIWVMSDNLAATYSQTN